MTGDRHISFEDWLAAEMEDEAFQTEYERLGPGFEVARLRMMRGLTQQELAERVDTHESNISRLESGERELSLSFLRRVVDALNGCLEVRIRVREEAVDEDAVDLRSEDERALHAEAAPADAGGSG